MEQLRVLFQRLLRVWTTSYSTSQQLCAAFAGSIAMAFLQHATKLLSENNGMSGEGGGWDIKYGGVNRGFRESIDGGIRGGIITKWPKPMAGYGSLAVVHLHYYSANKW